MLTKLLHAHAQVVIKVSECIQMMLTLTHSALISSNIQLSGKKVLTSTAAVLPPTLVVGSTVGTLMSGRVAGPSGPTGPSGTNVMRSDH